MALPKEPRQKMINIMYLVLTAILALNVSSEVIEAFKTVDKSLINSNTNIEASNANLFNSLAAKMKDPAARENAEIWSPKADQAKRLSDELNIYIEGLKKQLKEGAGLRWKEKDGKQVEDFKEDNLDASTRLFETNGKGKEFEAKLNAYKAAILDIHPEIKAEFANNFPVNADPIVGKEGTKKDFTSAYFHMTPTVAALTMLSKFQNNVKNAENQVVTFCHNKISAVALRMDEAAVLVGQSSNYVMPGEEVTITAGVGSYSSQGGTTISIGGQNVPVSAGQGSAKFTAVGSGLQKRQVTVRYLDQNKKEQTKTVEVSYTVGTPGGAAVMLDKMNVFYIGVDNPITISSGKGWDKTNVIPNGCSFSSGSNSNRMVRVTGGTTCSITVAAEGSAPKPFQFRIKRIPDPVFKIGDGKPRMPAVSFKNQQYCRADLENFDFDLKFSIVSADVYFGGANFANTVQGKISGNGLSGISNLIQRCGPGSSIAFENIKVSGPDGIRSIDGRSFQLY
jgi:gliding motility-associated protein GldM